MYCVENAPTKEGALNVRMMAVPITTTPAFAVTGKSRLLFEGPFGRMAPSDNMTSLPTAPGSSWCAKCPGHRAR